LVASLLSAACSSDKRDQSDAGTDWYLFDKGVSR
jgi:hypothetical protein